MALTRELNELVCRYDKYAELHRSAEMRDLERSVCGCAYGSTSWTTRREAELIAQLLALRPAAKLLAPILKACSDVPTRSPRS